MLNRTSLFALSALAIVNTVACNLGGAEPGEPSRLDPRPAVDEGAPVDEPEDQTGLPDEDPALPGMPDPSSVEQDTQTPADPMQPPPAAKPACDPAKPFGALSALPFNTGGYETGGRLSADELTLYFARSTNGATMKPFIATRTSKEEAWGAASVLSAIDSSGDDAYLTTSKDELVGFFASSRSGSLQIHRTTRASAATAWGGISLVASTASSGSDDDPFLASAGNAIYFDSNRSGTRSIYRAAIEADGSVGAPALVTTGANAVVTGDELTMYFSRMSGGQQDIRIAKRAAVTDAWGTSSVVGELNSASDDRVTWVSADGCRVIVSSERSGGAGSSDLYFATKPQ